jgi:hypothetical protein
MKRTVFGGLLLSLMAVITVVFGDALELGLPNPLLGLSVGAVLALVPGGHKLGRLVGFLLGGAFAFIGYGFNAQFMPSASIGVAVTAALTIGLATLAAALSFGRMPLWSLLLGIAGFTGAYDYTYSDKPYDFLNSSVATPIGMLVAFGFGYLTGAAVDLIWPEEEAKAEPAEAEEAETVGSEI